MRAKGGPIALATNVWNQISHGLQWAVESASRLSARVDKAPLDNVDRVFHFVSTRSALITQKKLYGYLKERIGLRYPTMVEDKPFAASINIANVNIFAAALSDMTIFAVAHAGAHRILDNAEHVGMASACYLAGLDDNQSMSTQEDRAGWRAAFADRIDKTAWENVAAGTSPFTESPKALIRWAPIAEELKKYDREIVENSIRFAWNEVTQDFRQRVNPEAVSLDWRKRREADQRT